MKENYKIKNLNRTKIIATIGPSSSSADVLEELIKNGCSVFRINFSHGSHESHGESIANIRKVAEKLNQNVAILGDLQGPKIRIGAIQGGSFKLTQGQELLLDSSIDDEAGSPDGVSYVCATLAESCGPGRVLMLDDGRVQLEVQSVAGQAIHTKVIAGTKLSSRKGLNLKGGGLAEDALTPKDMRDMAFAAKQNLEYICVSFPASAQDMLDARTKLDELDCPSKLIAKLERAEVVASEAIIDDMINSCDGVMVARGDLAVEVGFEAVTSYQKQIIARSRTLNKPVIVATQMMESMIDSPVPTRAEVSDVANAVFDYADAVMLSAETAVGDYPIEVIKTMYDVITATEKHTLTQVSKHRVEIEFQYVDESIAMASMYLANHFKAVKAIVCLTESGSTALWMSRIKTHLPLVAMSPRQDTLNRVALYKGVRPAHLPRESESNTRLEDVIQYVRKAVDLEKGDYVAITYGDVVGVDGHTNTLKLLQVT
ncbi:pyruvate kinase [Arenicella xantha]|uniref:Pyruvate kinase n=1 Tax=Arenicella xantha TaxID=644221 RepID=A0A395JJK9_9GAMM|nr:pyruvate kinase [Arenicella xantha]RBP49241.1 pyruvate kinase [Arenicella xantha]